MEIVRYAPTIEVEKGLWLERDKTYSVHSVRYSLLAGVLFELVEFKVEGCEHFHRLPANHFRSLNGKRAGIVRAIPNTEAFKKHGDELLYLSGLINLQGVELVRRREYRTPVEHLKALPYDQFEHM